MKALFGIFAAALATVPLAAQPDQSNSCRDLPSHDTVRQALTAAQARPNGGLGFHMWATVVNRDGEVCAVAFSGADRGRQWPGSRVISAQKANTANAFSLPGFALSTANLYAAVQPGGSLFGLQDSNPVNLDVAYRGDAARYGQADDPMVGGKIGGVNVFGGGLALYSQSGRLVGAVGVSGDTSCADHIIAWRVRYALNHDNVPAGVGAGNSDNIVHDVGPDLSGRLFSAGGFGHPVCSTASTALATSLPDLLPPGPTQ